MSNVVALIETKSHNAMCKVSTTSNHEALKLHFTTLFYQIDVSDFIYFANIYAFTVCKVFCTESSRRFKRVIRAEVLEKMWLIQAGK